MTGTHDQWLKNPCPKYKQTLTMRAGLPRHSLAGKAVRAAVLTALANDVLRASFCLRAFNRAGRGGGRDPCMEVWYTHSTLSGRCSLGYCATCKYVLHMALLGVRTPCTQTMMFRLPFCRYSLLCGAAIFLSKKKKSSAF